MNSIYNLFKKRRQVRWGWDQTKIPSKELIQELLEKAYDTAPSKQNLFPFKIHVIGPNNNVDNEKISKICALFNTGSVNNWEAQPHPNAKAPWVLIFELRKCDHNDFTLTHSKKHNDWKRFTQLDERFRDAVNQRLSSIEVGMFTKVLAGLCLERNLAISYIKSFPEWRWDEKRNVYKKNSNKVGSSWEVLDYITEMPLLVVQIGYKTEEWDPLSTNIDNPKRSGGMEVKPPIQDVIKYHLGTEEDKL